MKRFALAALAFSLIALPFDIGARDDSGSNLNAKLNGAIARETTLAATRTATFSNDELSGFGLLSLYVEITDANDSETGVSVACTAQRLSGKHEYRVPACVWDAANTRYNCEAGPLFWNPSDETTTNFKRQLFRFDIEGMSNGVCTFTFTGGAAADLIEVFAEGSVKG